MNKELLTELKSIKKALTCKESSPSSSTCCPQTNTLLTDIKTNLEDFVQNNTVPSKVCTIPIDNITEQIISPQSHDNNNYFCSLNISEGGNICSECTVENSGTAKFLDNITLNGFENGDKSFIITTDGALINFEIPDNRYYTYFNSLSPGSDYNKIILEIYSEDLNSKNDSSCGFTISGGMYHTIFNYGVHLLPLTNTGFRLCRLLARDGNAIGQDAPLFSFYIMTEYNGIDYGFRLINMETNFYKSSPCNYQIDYPISYKEIGNITNSALNCLTGENPNSFSFTMQNGYNNHTVTNLLQYSFNSEIISCIPGIDNVTNMINISNHFYIDNIVTGVINNTQSAFNYFEGIENAYDNNENTFWAIDTSSVEENYMYLADFYTPITIDENCNLEDINFYVDFEFQSLNNDGGFVFFVTDGNTVYYRVSTENIDSGRQLIQFEQINNIPNDQLNNLYIGMACVGCILNIYELYAVANINCSIFEEEQTIPVSISCLPETGLPVYVTNNSENSYNTTETIKLYSFENRTIESNYFHSITIKFKGDECQRSIDNGNTYVNMEDGDILSFEFTGLNTNSIHLQTGDNCEIIVDLIK